MAGVITVAKRALSTLRARRPWVDAGMIERLRGSPHTGAAVRLVSPEGEFVAWGLWSGDPRFPVRAVAWEPDVVLDPSYFREVAAESVRRRSALPLSPLTDAVRLVFGESDGLPGLVADRYGDFAVVAREGRFLDSYLTAIAEGIAEAAGLAGVVLRDRGTCRTLCGSPAPSVIRIREGDLEFDVDPYRGQKTGWFCDQRENRLRVAAYARGADVLDVFCYTGGFAVAALARGARSVHLVDSSAAALAMARRNLELNGCPVSMPMDQCDAMDRLRDLAREQRVYDLVILDPPKLQPPHGDPPEAEQAYLRLQTLAMRLLGPGGLLATFSCSGAMSRSRFDGVVAKAAAARPCRILERLGQPADHPVLLPHPKSEYLKGLILQLS